MRWSSTSVRSARSTRSAWWAGQKVALRGGLYAATHTGKVDSLVLLAPLCMTRAPPEPMSVSVMGITTRQSFEANWDNQLGCADRYDATIRDALWDQLVETDPTGAELGPHTLRGAARPYRAQHQRSVTFLRSSRSLCSDLTGTFVQDDWSLSPGVHRFRRQYRPAPRSNASTPSWLSQPQICVSEPLAGSTHVRVIIRREW
jgi:hypothetical protein